MKPKIVSEEEVSIKLPKKGKRKCDVTNSGLQNLETKMKKRKQKEEKEQEVKENEDKEPVEENKAARGVESYFGESGDDADEYEPDSDEESNSDEESEYDENCEFQDDDELDADLRTEQTFADFLNDTITVDQNSKASAPDDRELSVDPTSCTAKKHFCLFCKKFQAKIARHLQLKHHDQEEVKKFMALSVKSQERKQIISIIRKNGDHVYNTDRQFNSGKLIVCRRPAAHREKKAEDFIACGNCKGQYSRLVIRHHWRKCTKQNSKAQRIILVKGKKVSARLHERANADVRKHIFPYLREDEVVRSIRYDELLIVFANKQCEQYGTNQHLFQMVRARLRLLGRLLIAIKSLNPRITSFTDIFQPRHYDFLIEAVKKLLFSFQKQKPFCIQRLDQL
ncbi:uncharacterized protein LOC141534098 [Cotesia typhae]|uniref:uncharacterized protein LOC141534098 n=1 Tax=Cotesia typhae TaxID=2053667 RepID=UPI003D682EE3